MFDEAERYRINVFDWEDEFAQVFADGGFDAVIGNPPYGAFYSEEEKRPLQSQICLQKGKPETYIYFVEQGRKLLSKKGKLGYIILNT